LAGFKARFPTLALSRLKSDCPVVLEAELVRLPPDMVEAVGVGNGNCGQTQMQRLSAWCVLFWFSQKKIERLKICHRHSFLWWD
jgi:hypothetical protein